MKTLFVDGEPILDIDVGVARETYLLHLIEQAFPESYPVYVVRTEESESD